MDVAVEKVQFTRYRFVVLAIILLLLFSTGLSMFSLGPLTPMIIDHYGISYGAASLLSSSYWAIHMLLPIPASLLVGRVDMKKFILLAAILNCAPVLTFLTTDSFTSLLVVRIVYSAAFAIFFVSFGPTLMQWFRPKDLPVVNGLYLVAPSIGITVASFLITPIAERIGWEMALTFMGATGLIPAIAWLIWGKNHEGMQILDNTEIFKRLVVNIRSRNVILIACADAGVLTFLSVAFAWLPTFYKETYGFSLVKSGNLMGLLMFSGILSVIVASIIARRSSRRRPFLIYPGIFTGLAAFGALFFGDSFLIYPTIALLGIAVWAYLPALLTIPMDLYPNDPNRVALTNATMISLGGAVAIVAPLVVGFGRDMTGSFIPAFSIFAVVSWSLLICGYLLPETGYLSGKKEKSA